MSRRRVHLARIGLLLAASAAIQSWTIRHAAVPALDSVRFVAAAQAIEQDGLWQCWRRQSEHLLYPFVVSIVHRCLRYGLSDPATGWAEAAQLAAAIPLVLAVIPVYLGALRLVGARGALVAGLLFCLAGELARLGADGLSDSTQLLFLATSWWLLLEAFERLDAPAATPQRWLSAALMFGGGAAAGLAMLARAESAVLVPAALVALVAWRLRELLPAAGRLSALPATALVAGWLAVWGPFLTATGTSRLDQALSRVLGRPDGEIQRPAAVEQQPASATFLPPADAAPSRSWADSSGAALSFPVKDATTSIRFRGWPAAVAEFAAELATVFSFWVGGLALCGWIDRVRRGPRAVDILAQSFFVLYASAALVQAAQNGYLSTRHLIPLLLPGLAWAGQGTAAIESWWRLWRQRRPLRRARLERRLLPSLAWRRTLGPLSALGVVALAAALACVPKTLLPLHASRRAHREAASWIARHAHPHERVLDTRGWTGLYSGRQTYRFHAAPSAFDDPGLGFVVLERQEIERESPRGRSLRHMLARFAQPEVTFVRPGLTAGAVVVYRWRGDRLAAADRGGSRIR